MGTHYEKALSLGRREISRRKARGESGYLPVLDEIAPGATALPAQPLNLVTIPLKRVVGTATRGRTSAFAANFMPAIEPVSEFADKWERLYASVVSEGVNSPIKAYEYMNKFYVIEGNKRVSVMKYLDAATIEGEVTRLLPPLSDDSEVQLYYEFVHFYADTGLNNIYFSRRGSFDRMYGYTGTKPGEKWPGSLRRDFKSAFFHFSTCYSALGGGELSLTEGDAFEVFLRIYGFKHACEATGDALMEDVRRIWDEIVMSAQEERVVLLMEPKASSEEGSIFSLFRRPRRLRAAFLYNRPVAGSGWTFWHEMGRQYVDTVMDGRVETRCEVAQTDDEASEALSAMAEDGADVIFTTSPQFLNAAIRASVGREELKILNCSLQTPYHHIRSYYLRVYEAKYILGAIAGAVTEDHRVGYIADYPIYGTPAGINAFALGARLTDPSAQVYLEWSGLKDHDPAESLRRSGVRVICNRDVSAPAKASREFGLYRVDGGETQSLAMPVLNWGALYETILRSVLTGGWESDEDVAPRLAMAYWPGMSTGAVDVICSRRLPEGTRRLVALLRDWLRDGRNNLFSGRIVSQDGVERAAADESLNPARVVAMDWLADNVIGSIPDIESLRPEAQPLVKLQGLFAADRPDAAAINWTGET